VRGFVQLIEIKAHIQAAVVIYQYMEELTQAHN